MTDFLSRARTALGGLLGGPQAAKAPAPRGTVDTVTFPDLSRASAEPDSWLPLFNLAVEARSAVADEALAVIAKAVDSFPTDTWYQRDDERRRLLAFLRPRLTLAAHLGDMKKCGWLGRLIPEAPADAHALRAVAHLEGLPHDAALTGERFGTMLRELATPELLTLSLLLLPAATLKPEPVTDAHIEKIGGALDRLRLPADRRQLVEFLLRSRFQMSQVAFRQDTADPDVVAEFAASLTKASLLNTVSAEEHLKTLCLLTVADLGAIGAQALTPWKAELLWRLFVDTFNQLTMAYGDEVIDKHAAARTALHAHRPADIEETELTRFLEGLPTRYLTLFDPESIYHHVRLGRDMRDEDVHFFLSRKPEAWELTVVSLDKPFLFSNICGLLSHLDMDILRGQALTSLSGLVVDVFQFTDRTGFLERSSLDPLLSAVIAGRIDVAALLHDRERGVRAAHAMGTPPVIYFDNESSRRYTVLEIVAEDAPGLLYRVSRALSRSGCAVDLVLISTEERTAMDVFHLRKQGAKLSDSEQLALTAELETALADAAST